MHIAEGVLSAPVLITGAAAAAAGIAVGLKRLDESRLMTAGLVGAAFFIASLIHVPIGVSSAHLLLCGLVGVMLGVSAYPVIFTALLLQGVLFEFGGLAVLGVNTTTMGTGALAFSSEGFVASAAALLAAHVPIMAAEAVITALVVDMIARTYPELLHLGEERPL
ncbi:energy-coupling factor ABC transporter permease [Sutterella wadsworthensis]|uniref:energy-coupling factor ABC transporter permease n=1 Tax=Sutterella wadsworthensis TaxID=40545 RepID=UPI0013F5E1BF|nr:energy-coupling factor ABC transporter permease [Sutterella wadsworthensis]